MKALLRKDSGWILIFLLTGIVIPFMMMLAEGFNNLWITSSRMFYLVQEYYLVWLGFGLAFGLFAGLLEELTRTTDYLRHRPVSDAQIFIAKTGACLATIAAWILVPLGLQLILIGLMSDNAVLAEKGRFFTYATIGLIAFSSFGAGYFAASLRLSWPKRLILGVAAMISVYSISFTVARYFGGWANASSTAYVLVHIGFTVIFLHAAFRQNVSRIDADLPMERKPLRVAGTVSVALAIIASCFLPALIQSSLYEELTHSYPNLIKTKDGQVRLYRFNNELERHMEVDAQNRFIPESTIDLKQVNSAESVWFSPFNYKHGGGYFSTKFIGQYSVGIPNLFQPGVEVRGFCGFAKLAARTDVWDRCSLIQPEGVVYRQSFASPTRPGKPYLKKLAKGPEQKAFSPNAVILNDYFKPIDDSRYATTAMIGDGEDGGIWVYDMNGEIDHFTRLDALGIDRFISVVYIHEYRDQLVAEEKIEIDGHRYTVDEDLYQYAIYTDRASYLWNGINFEEGPAWLHEAIRGIEVDPFIVRSADPIAIEVDVLDAAGKPIFSHEYGLKTWHEKIVGGGLYSMSLLRAPVTQFINAVMPGIFERSTDETTSSTTSKTIETANAYEARLSLYGSSMFDDPLVLSGKRIWLLLTNFVIAGALAYHAARRLKRLGASGARRWYWAVCIALGGLFVYLLYRAIETDRAYRPVTRIAPEQAPAPLICTR